MINRLIPLVNRTMPFISGNANEQPHEAKTCSINNCQPRSPNGRAAQGQPDSRYRSRGIKKTYSWATWGNGIGICLPIRSIFVGTFWTGGSYISGKNQKVAPEEPGQNGRLWRSETVVKHFGRFEEYENQGFSMFEKSNASSTFEKSRRMGVRTSWN